MKKNTKKLPNPFPNRELQDRLHDLTKESARDYFNLFDRHMRDYLDIVREYHDTAWNDEDEEKSTKGTKK
jgi:hypothetical protein